ncbi:subtilisin-like protein [Ascobolus immersus RN42]|uniref:Subtilisin-like protein n=1 Tax=Ascobolus immersus RN42 TaxID=1160509 RepID=A0A3N4HR20_ASCIM|nr:subtilisin-like protein [Ascobolus immersus RN42]
MLRSSLPVHLWPFVLICLASLYTASAQPPPPSSAVRSSCVIEGGKSIDQHAAWQYWSKVNGPTGVTKLHQEGYCGQFVTIGVFDASFALDHPALLGRVHAQYNFITGDSLSIAPNTKAAFSHGTQCAIAAVGGGQRILAPAFGGKLAAYKIAAGMFDKTTSTSSFNAHSVDLGIALQKAKADGCSIFSFSTGLSTSWSVGVVQETITEAHKQDYLIVAAATNEGWKGIATLSNRSSAKGSLVVTNFDDGFIPGYKFEVTVGGTGVYAGTKDLRIVYGNFRSDGFSARLALLLPTGSRHPIDLCSFKPSSTDSLPRPFPVSFLLMKVSAPTFDCLQRIRFLLEMGISGAFLWTEVSERAQVHRPLLAFERFGAKDKSIPIGWLHDSTEAQNLQQALLDGTDVTFEFPELPEIVSVAGMAGDPPQLYSMSGSGPTYDLSLGIHVVAPGTELLTGDFLDDKYLTATGASIATPYVSGMAAQVLSFLGGPDRLGPGWAERVKNRIIHSSSPILASPNQKSNRPFDSALYEPTSRQGAGQPDAWKAAHSPIEIDKSHLELNDTNYAKKLQQLTFTNVEGNPIVIMSSELISLSHLLL